MSTRLKLRAGQSTVHLEAASSRSEYSFVESCHGHGALGQFALAHFPAVDPTLARNGSLMRTGFARSADESCLVTSVPGPTGRVALLSLHSTFSPQTFRVAPGGNWSRRSRTSGVRSSGPRRKRTASGEHVRLPTFDVMSNPLCDTGSIVAARPCIGSILHNQGETHIIPAYCASGGACSRLQHGTPFVRPTP